MKKFLLLLIAALLFPQLIHAGEDFDSTKVYFRIGKSAIDPYYRDNAARLQRFEELLRPAMDDSIVDKILIHSYASPDGSSQVNERLCRERCNSLVDYMTGRLGVDSSFIESIAEGVAWDELRRMVADDASIPYRDEILEALDTPVWVYDNRGRVVDSRKKRLMDLRGGRPYRYLYENVFPDLRNGLAIQINYRVDRENDAAEAARLKAEAEAEEQRRLAAEEAARIARQQAEAEAAEAARIAVAQTVENDAQETDSEPIHRLAVKTNMIYDALLMPNLELEYRIDDRWSVALEADVAWWHNNRRHKYYQIAMMAPEGRYWFKSYKPWHGHYVGLFAGGGKYDLENGARGYKGEGFLTGASYGFMFPIARNLSLEAEVGIGYLYTRYSEYLPLDGHYLFQKRSRTNYFGPLKVKFSIVWRLWDDNKKKGTDL